MASKGILLAGFGGQGVLFIGKVLATAGLVEKKEVSWLPSYGPEMRGGTANCSVMIADEQIGSPLVSEPDILIVMNMPSFEKFIDKVTPGGIALVDSTLVSKKAERADISVFYIPATALAAANSLKGFANIILLGKLLKESGIAAFDSVKKAIEKSVPAKKAALVEVNMKAIALGMSL